MAAARRDATYDEVMQERREAEYAARKAGKPELAETSSDSAAAEESADEKKKPFFLLVLAAMGPGVVSAWLVTMRAAFRRIRRRAPILGMPRFGLSP